MKKCLSILVASMALLIPFNAKAASAQVKFTCDKKCVDNGDTCERTCDLSLTGDVGSVDKFTSELILSPGLTVTSVTEGDPAFVREGNDNSRLDFTNLSYGTPLSNVKLATIKVNVPKDAVDCSIQLKPTGFETIKVTVSTEQTVKTGATLPIAIIFCGAVAAGVVYYVSTKNTKMYKI